MNNTYQSRLNLISNLTANLKIKFTGLDRTIDKIMEQITPWFVYQMPRKMPLVINIWGITGTGKTELVTDICKGLELPTSFFDSQEFFSNKSSSLKMSSLRALNSDSERKAIILDEFHRLKTKTKNEVSKTEDARARLWEILGGSIKFNYGFEDILKEIQSSYQIELSYNDNPPPTPRDKPKDVDFSFISSRHHSIHRRIFMKTTIPLKKKLKNF